MRTGALFAIINDEAMIMVYHKGYDAVYTVLCSSSSSSSSGSHSYIIVVVLVVVSNSGSGGGGGSGSCIAETVQ